MKIFLLLISMLNAYSQSCPIYVHPHERGIQSLDLLKKNQSISQEDDIKEKLMYTFSKNQDHDLPIKDGTRLLQEFKAMRDQLPKELIDRVERRQREVHSKQMAEYISPSGLFRINYETDGFDAVPTADDNNNMIPDYVEKTAEYFDHSYDHLVTQFGYDDPILNGQKYNIYYELSGAYGYTVETSDESTTEIYIHSNMSVAAPNTDPEGQILGALKVTCAHEFMHAIQYKMNKRLFNDFSDYWVELDAVWVEEFVYDEVNDYYNYIESNSSVLRFPTTSLNNTNGTGSYEDVIWQIYLTEKHGNDFMQDFWKRRKNNPNEDVIDTYANIISKNSSDLATAIQEFSTWNYLTAERYKGNIGYSEAEHYPLSLVKTSLPIATEYTRNVSNFATQQLTLTGAQNQYLSLQLSSEPNIKYVVTYTNALNQSEVINLTNNEYHFQLWLSDLNDAALLVINTETDLNSTPFTINSSLSNTPSENQGSDNIQLVQNPIRNHLISIRHPQIVSGEKNDIKIYNVLGQYVWNSTMNIGSELTSIPVPSNMAAGIYYAVITIKNTRKAVKFVFVK